MLVREATWMGQAILRTGLVAGARVLNVGSSTGRFRTVEQPWVDTKVFEPLRDLGVDVVHLDLKPAEGVDLIGDLLDPAFRDGLKGGWDVAICSNLLEHLEDRASLLEVLPVLVKPGGWLVVTVPCRFPFHPDPIDTMYRPDPGELVRDLQAHAGEVHLELTEAMEVADNRYWTYWAHYARLRGRAPLIGLAGLLARSPVDVHKRAELCTLSARTSATCVMARRSLA
jgi:SAM-dependent methyltransferase